MIKIKFNRLLFELGIVWYNIDHMESPIQSFWEKKG